MRRDVIGALLTIAVWMEEQGNQQASDLLYKEIATLKEL